CTAPRYPQPITEMRMVSDSSRRAWCDRCGQGVKTPPACSEQWCRARQESVHGASAKVTIGSHRGGHVYRLTNVVKHYDWGSMTAIPTFLGAEADGRPVAEVWMGAHPDGPSRVRGRSLRDLIDDDPAGTVGLRVSARFGDRLPYLFKVLAASRPL